MSDERLTISVEDAARLLGISRGLAYEAARRGELPVIRLGRRLLVPRSQLLQLVETSEPREAGSSPKDLPAGPNADGRNIA
jgi:excisionase family DNA binding protein